MLPFSRKSHLINNSPSDSCLSIKILDLGFAARYVCIFDISLILVRLQLFLIFQKKNRVEFMTEKNDDDNHDINQEMKKKISF